MQITHPKRKGEYVEARFLAKMLELGYTVSKPWGDSARYDFVIEKNQRNDLSSRASRSRAGASSESRDLGVPIAAGAAKARIRSLPQLIRVQVKSCWRRTGNHYAFRTTGNTPCHPTYTARDLDFIAALVVPLDLWYIVPISAISPGQSFFYVFPHSSTLSSRESAPDFARPSLGRAMGARARDPDRAEGASLTARRAPRSGAVLSTNDRSESALSGAKAPTTSSYEQFKEAWEVMEVAGG